MSMYAKVRRLRLREGLSISEIARRTSLSRNTIKTWLKEPEPRTAMAYRREPGPRILDDYAAWLDQAIKTDAHRPRKERRTARRLYEQLQEQGFTGHYCRVTEYLRARRAAANAVTARSAYVPLQFGWGEAFQFDWSEEGLVIGGIWRKLQLAHMKLCASRAFWMVAYPSQGHEMLFDAHLRCLTGLGGVPRRGIYDNMKTAVDKVGRGKERDINPRFFAMCGHYLFEPEFCNRAAGWEKGRVEKNVQDRRRQIWQRASDRRWKDLDELNAWLGEQCRQAWADMANPEWPALTIGDLLQDELMQMLPNPKPFDGYVEKPVRVTSTALIHFQRNRYSVPAEHAHAVLSLRIYPNELRLVADGQEVARYARSFERDQTFYDFTHYIGVVDRKPGALRNGAPFAEMPEPLLRLQRHLLRQSGGDRVMADVLGAIPHHGLDAVLVAAELALESGRPSGEHVLNVLARLKSGMAPTTQVVTTLAVREEPKSDVHRYDRLRTEARHVD